MITNLTEGPIRKTLWLYSIPMLVSVMFQQIYNIADSMIAGKFAGEDALAAVGASYPILCSLLRLQLEAMSVHRLSYPSFLEQKITLQ